MNRKLRGPAGFEQYYQALYQARWPSLKDALRAPVAHVRVENPYFRDRKPGEAALQAAYELDPASRYPVQALGLIGTETVLDLCAAPGGKTLLIHWAQKRLAQGRAETGRLISNELSKDRRHRLLRVLEQYVPEAERERIQVTGRDAATWCRREREAYDRILADVPCSSERHLLQDPKHLESWSEARGRNLAQRQWAILSSAFLALKPGGTLVYSTCAIDPRENDGVIQRLLDKYAEEALVEPVGFELGERTEHGWIALPDRGGAGPLYVSRVGKRKNSERIAKE